jgi:peptide/nickel transport system permease protein
VHPLVSYIARRLASLVVTVLVAAALSYAAMSAAIEGSVGNVPDYLTGMALHGDFGTTYGGGCNPQEFIMACSHYEPGPVSHLLRDRVPVDLQLLLGAMLLGAALGLIGGRICAVRPASKTAHVLRVLTAFQLSCPPYWQGFAVLILVADKSGMLVQLPFASATGEFVPLTQNPLIYLKAMWLPWLLVGLPLAAYVLRITDASLRDILQEDYMRTARAKGLSRRLVVRRHALPVATPPIALMTGVNVSTVLMNAALMESAFNVPGMYRLIRSSVYVRDLWVIQAMVIEGVVLVVAANALADLIQAAMDPRVRA